MTQTTPTTHHGTMIIKGQSMQALVQALIETAREEWERLYCVPTVSITDDGCQIAVYSLPDPEGQGFDVWLWRMNDHNTLKSLGIEIPPNTLGVIQ